ncbi:MAG: MerR family transcriptional regulator [Ferrimicrobium sp.]
MVISGSIGVVAREMGVHPDTLRRWEKETG